MTAPRHLWSGDWQDESAAAAEELASRRVQTERPGARPTPAPAKRSPAASRRPRRGRPRRGTLLLILAMVASAGLAFAGVLWLFGPSAHSSPRASSRAPAWLGVDLAIALPAGFLSPNGGVLIASVAPGSPAAAAGLEPGDLITQIGNRPVAAPADIQSAIAGMHPGEQLQIQYERGLQAYATQATLAARPPNP